MEKYEIRGEVSTIRFTQKNSATPGGTRKGEEKGGEGGEEGEEGEEGEGEEGEEGEGEGEGEEREGREAEVKVKRW